MKESTDATPFPIQNNVFCACAPVGDSDVKTPSTALEATAKPLLACFIETSISISIYRKKQQPEKLLSGCKS